jgi:hypothetical protein
MTLEIIEGLAPSESSLMPMTPKQLEQWEVLEAQMIEIARRGHVIELPFEHPALQNYVKGKVPLIGEI